MLSRLVLFSVVKNCAALNVQFERTLFLFHTHFPDVTLHPMCGQEVNSQNMDFYINVKLSEEENNHNSRNEWAPHMTCLVLQMCSVRLKCVVHQRQ
jgi:hypothetical protein